MTNTPSPYKRDVDEQLWQLAEKLGRKFDKLNSARTDKTIRTQAYLAQVLTGIFRQIGQRELSSHLIKSGVISQSNPEVALELIKGVLGDGR